MSISLIKNNKTTLYVLCLILLCFLLNSAGYLSWVYHMIYISPNINASVPAEILGYFFQALGILLYSILLKMKPVFTGRNGFITVIFIYVLLLIPSLLTSSLTVTIVFGYFMNIFCGLTAGFYLNLLSSKVNKKYRGKVFGFGYGGSCIILWLATLAGDFLHEKNAMIIYAVLAILSAGIYISLVNPGKVQENSYPERKISSFNRSSLLVLAFLTVIMLSLVKDLGFDFPAADLTAGIDITLSRVFYGAGLIIAGLITDKSRKAGAVLCMAALVIPFIMLVLSDETVPSMILWSLNYFFYGFFSVYRVILFSDIAYQDQAMWLSGSGLLAGRIGDAAGTLIFITLGSITSVLVIITATLFILTVFLFFRIFQQFYLHPEKSLLSETERFEQFSIKYSCSQREREVLRLILSDKTNQEISSTLFVSESTVKFHIHNLLKKTGCKNRMELIALYHTE